MFRAYLPALPVLCLITRRCVRAYHCNCSEHNVLSKAQMRPLLQAWPFLLSVGCRQGAQGQELVQSSAGFLPGL